MKIKSIHLSLLAYLFMLTACGYDSNRFLKDFLMFTQDKELNAQEYMVLAARVNEASIKGGFNFPYQGQFVSLRSEQDLKVLCQTLNIKVENPKYLNATVAQMAQTFAEEMLEAAKYGTLNLMIMNDDMGENQNLDILENQIEEYYETLNEMQQEEFERVFKTTIQRGEMNAALNIVSGVLGFL